MLNNIPKTAIIGSSGFLGKFFLSAYRRVYPDNAGTVKYGAVDTGENIFLLDLLNPKVAPLRLSETGYKEALIFAAVTNVSVCEKEKTVTRRINVEGTLELIRQLAEEGIKPVFFSTDHVFDGKEGSYSEHSPVNPITEYGRQKAEVESKIAEITRGNFLVVRLSKVFSLDKGDDTLFDEMARILLSGAEIKAAFDQIFCPTFIKDIISAVSRLQVNGINGIVNLCSPEVWSRYDLAVALVKKMGIGISKVRKVSLDEIMVNPKYPKNTSMISKILPKKNQVFTPVNSCIERVAAGWMANE